MQNNNTIMAPDGFSITGEQDPKWANNANFANQTGDPNADPNANDDSSSWFDTAFASNLATSIGTIGGAALGVKPPTKAAPTGGGTLTPPLTPPPNYTMWWVIGGITAVAVIGVVIFMVRRGSGDTEVVQAAA